MKYNHKDFLLHFRLLLFKFKKQLSLLTEIILCLLSSISIFLLILIFGYELSPSLQKEITQGCTIILLFFFISSTLRFILNLKDVIKEKLLIADVFIYIVLFGALCSILFFPDGMKEHLPFLHFLSNKWLVYSLLAILSIINISKFIFKFLSAKINPSLLFIYSFLFLIFIGTGLLLLPNSYNHHLSFIDALFTATSSVCVTGLTSVDISTAFTFSGQIIILFLIQIGGIGVMTFTSFFALSFMGKSSFESSVILKDFLNEENLGNMFKTLVNILIVTIIIEGIGAYLIWSCINDVPDKDAGEKIFLSIFHSISAFCNAGISTLPGNLGNTIAIQNYSFQFWIAILIIVGGLGFPIVFNYMHLFQHFMVNSFNILIKRQKHYIHHPWIIHVHTRIVMSMTLILIISGTLLIFLLEKNHSFIQMSDTEKLISAFFNAVVPRTAGFSTVDVTHFAQPTLFLILLLMMIGAAPMSTGGGIKVSTIAIAIMATFNIARGKQHLEINRREIRQWNIGKAFAVIYLYIIWMFIATAVLVYTEKNDHIFTLLFEVTSALSTVGLSLNFSSQLSVAGKYIIIITMFIGRIGVLTFLSGILKRYNEKNYKYPEAGVII